jgi:hypothetical protein
MMMAVAKRDQERVTYAWMYGQQARKDGKERAVPDYWEEHAEAWLQGFDGVPLGSEPKPVTDQLEAELNESAVSKPE